MQKSTRPAWLKPQMLTKAFGTAFFVYLFFGFMLLPCLNTLAQIFTTRDASGNIDPLAVIRFFFAGNMPRFVWNSLKLALCLLFFFPGMPCVYYGDEIGMTGGYAPDCRKGFIWDETAWDAELRRHVQLLARLKTGGRLAGDVIRISVSDDVLTLEREELTLLVNASSRAARYCFRGREGQIAANGFVILDADASIIKEE